MTDLDIITLIERYIADLLSQDDTKYRREIKVLLKLRDEINKRVATSLVKQAEQAMTQPR